MFIEIVVLLLFFIFSLLLLYVNKNVSVFILLFLSVLLHKELFSIYRWDILPIRVFMLALLCFSVFSFFKWFRKKEKTKTSQLFAFLKEPFVFLLLLLWLIRGISIVFSKNLVGSMFLFGFFTTVVVLGLFLYQHFSKKPHQLFNYIRAYFFIAFGLCLFAYFQYFLYAKYDVIIGALWNVPNNIPRLGATFWDVNHFAAMLAALLPVLGVLILVERPFKKQFLYSLMFVPMTGLLLLTSSRTAWIIAFVSFVVFSILVLFRKFGLKGVSAFILILFLLFGAAAKEYSNKASPFRAKIKNFFHYRIDSFASHFMLLRGSLEVFENYPILGGGYGGFFEHFSKTDVAAEYFGRDPAALNTRVPAHTIWGELVAETGILGLVTYVALALLVLSTLLYLAQTTDAWREFLLSSAMFSSLLGWFLAGIFYSYKSEFFWIILFFYFIYGYGLLGRRAKLKNILCYFIKSAKFPIVLLCVLSIPLIFWRLGSTHLIPWDEAIYAKIAKNMVTSGDYIVQTWKPSTVWYEKPPLYMWLMAFFMNILGFDSLAARLPSALCGFFTVLLVYAFGKRVFNKTVGFISAFCILTTFHFLYYSRSSMLDVTALFFITLALYFYWLARTTTKFKFWLWTGIASGLAVMTKGVVGFLPFPIIGLFEFYTFFQEKTLPGKQRFKKYFGCVLLSTLVFMPWHLEMYRQFGSSFIDNYIGYHVLKRATSAIEDKNESTWWYLVVMKVSMRIWFVALLGALPTVILYALKRSEKHIFILIWTLFVFLFFSIAKSKLIWYILPIYPAASIMIGVFIERFLHLVMRKIPRIDTVVFKFTVLYGIICFGLFYLFLNKHLVYTSDLTGSQAELLQLSDVEFDANTKIYADRVELPLILFYSDGPFEVVDFGPLKKKLAHASYDERIVFITKESRFRKFSETYPELKLTAARNEWVLGYLPSEYELDKKSLKEIMRQIEDIEKNIIALTTEGKLVPVAMRFELGRLRSDADKWELKIAEEFIGSRLPK